MPTTPASSKRTKTYNSRLVSVVIDNNIITGLADDGFLQLSPLTDGILAQRGCDGEVARAIDPNTGFAIKLTLLQTSASNSVLNNYFIKDRKSGEGVFSLEIYDATGGLKFQVESAWITKPVDLTYGKGINNREWNIETGPADEWDMAFF